MLVLREFPFFVMAFFKVTQNFSLLEATVESGCVVEGEKVLCTKLLFYVVLLKWWKQGMYENFRLCLMSTNKCLE
jgi:F0F1-type ATP synthase assembly protein I